MFYESFYSFLIWALFKHKQLLWIDYIELSISDLLCIEQFINEVAWNRLVKFFGYILIVRIKETFINFSCEFSDSWVKMILHRVVSSPYQVLTNLGPFVSKLWVFFKNGSFLVFRNWILCDMTLQMVMVSLSTLLACSPFDSIIFF